MQHYLLFRCDSFEYLKSFVFTLNPCQSWGTISSSNIFDLTPITFWIHWWGGAGWGWGGLEQKKYSQRWLGGLFSPSPWAIISRGGGQPNSSSAPAAKAYSPVAFPDGKVLWASEHFPEDKVSWIRRTFCSFDPHESNCLVAFQATCAEWA